MTTYRCDRRCPIGRKCYICKVDKPLPDDVTFIVKCQFLKQDIPVSAERAKAYSKLIQSKTE